MRFMHLIPALVAMLCAPELSAQRVQLDDSLSPIDTLAVELAWEPGTVQRAMNELMAGVPNAGPPLTGRIDSVDVRLDTSAFVGRSARIYLTLPAIVPGLGSPGDLTLNWDATQPFIGGAVRPGQSTLVFEGLVEAVVTRAQFSFALRLDRGADTDTFDLEPFYELEVLP